MQILPKILFINLIHQASHYKGYENYSSKMIQRRQHNYNTTDNVELYINPPEPPSLWNKRYQLLLHTACIGTPLQTTHLC